jgi:hypothetical protein
LRNAFFSAKSIPPNCSEQARIIFLFDSSVKSPVSTILEAAAHKHPPPQV